MAGNGPQRPAFRGDPAVGGLQERLDKLERQQQQEKLGRDWKDYA